MATVDPLAYFSKTAPNGVSVRSHLAELIHSLLTSKDPDALAKLESLSLDVKAAHFEAKQPGSKVKPTLPAGSLPTAQQSDATVPTEAWFKAAKKQQQTADPAALPRTAELPELMSLFEPAGVGMSKEETFRTYLAMAQLKKKHNLKVVRFFGKICGTKQDYVVVEAGLTPEAHLPPSAVGATPPEGPGVGLNSATYFVAPSAVDEFVQLEDVTPEAVLAAQRIRKYFTGELGAPVACYPAFPGPESAYLRAQIARICQATAVMPANYLVKDEESEATPQPLIRNADYAVPDDLPEPTAWVHGYQGILKIGRCTNVPKVVVEGEEEAEEEEVEEEIEALKPIAEDAAIIEGEEGEGQAAWSSRFYQKEFAAYSVAIATSNRWPGAYSAIAKQGEKHASVYFGWGQPKWDKVFTLTPFPSILDESPETEEAAVVSMADEKALLKEIDDARNEAANADAEGDE